MTRVLLVDDNEENLYYLSSLLGAHGFEIERARHGAEALVRARAVQPDVVISDLLMPVMDGFTLLRQWKIDPQLRTAPFIVYTATYTDEEDERLALDLGADAFILKPTEPEDFVTQLTAALARTQTSEPVVPAPEQRDDELLLREYSAVLIRKLEEKTLQLEVTNRSLQQDIDARVRAEDARDEAQRQAAERAALLDAVFASVPDVVVQLDLSGNVRLINRATPLFSESVTPGFACGPAAYQQAMQGAFASVIGTRQATSFEVGLHHGAESTTYWISLAPVLRGDEIRGAVGVVRDISERKRSEAQLIVADRMASLGSLSASVAHEINNPLLCVTGNLEVLERLLQLHEAESGRPLAGSMHEALRDAREGAERVRVIVRDLRIFSRTEDASLGAVDLEQVLDSTLRMAWNELRHRARLIKRYGAVPPVRSNESRLGQVFLNLIVNAVQAIPEGNHERNEVCVETRFDALTRRVIVAISDTGSGIPPEIQARLFTPFVTTKPPGVGTGLGLSICHRIVTALDGSIDFVSELGRGTTFRVSLPAAEAPSAHTPAVTPAIDAPVRRGAILLVDDDDKVAHVVRRALSPEHTVNMLHSAETALALFRRGMRFDLVLCDLMMPQMTGIDLYHALKALDPEQASRVVFMTGGAFTPGARNFLDSVSNQRLEKPFEISALRALVNQRIR
jgi:signal transduction histidine kinase